MEKYHFVIVGGGIAGTNAAEVIRQKDPQNSILLITEEKDRLYSRVLLPHYLRDETEYNRLFLKKADFYDLNHIIFKPTAKVTSLDTDKQLLKAEKGVEYHYEKLLLATGGQLQPWSVTGSTSKGVHYLRTIEDVVNLREALQTAKQAIVVGGGFIALDLLNSLIKQQIAVTALVREKYFFQNLLDAESAGLIQGSLEKNGVRFIFSDEIEAVEGADRVEKVKTKAGQELDCDLIGVGIGVLPNLDYLRSSKIDHDRFIKTDQYLQTNITNVWAAGDAASFFDTTSNRYHNLGNWANAADQGLVAGQNMVGAKEEVVTSSTYSINFLGGSLAVIGDTAKEGVEMVFRGSHEVGRRGVFYIKDQVIVGATLVNLPQDRGALTNLIRNKVKIDSKALTDLNFNLSQFLS